MCQLNESVQPLYQCLSVSDFTLLKWEIATFISSGLWLQHPDVNPVVQTSLSVCMHVKGRLSSYLVFTF